MGDTIATSVARITKLAKVTSYFAQYLPASFIRECNLFVRRAYHTLGVQKLKFAYNLSAFLIFIFSWLCCSACHQNKEFWPASSIRVADPAIAKQLIAGFYEVSENRWRWTGPVFEVALKPPRVRRSQDQPLKSAELRVQIYFPEAEINQLGPITMTAQTSGHQYESTIYSKGGSYEFVADIPADALCTNVLPITFSLDKYLHASKTDPRDLGVVVTSFTLSVAD